MNAGRDFPFVGGRLLALGSLLVVSGGCAPSATTPPPALGSSASPARLGSAADQYVEAGGVRLRYREIGAGTPVLLLHGYTQRLEDMGPLADSLAGSYRAIVLDQRGFGKSTKLADPTRFGRLMADDVIRLLDALHIPRAHLVGHSMGAIVASSAAIRNPDRIATTTLVGGPFFTDSAAFAREMLPFIAALERGEGVRGLFIWLFPGLPDSVVTGANAQVMAQNDLGSLLAVMRSMGGLVVTRDRAGEIRAPAIFAVGLGDPLLPQSRAAVTWWPRSRLLEIEGANHADVITRPELIAAIRELVGKR